MASHGSSVSGVILAAGGSSRLGRPKQLLPLAGEPLLRHVVRAALESELAEVILVLGHQAGAVARAVGSLGQTTVVNTEYRAGQSTSLVAGINAVSSTATGALILLGDQPEINADIINPLVAAFGLGEPLVVVPSYRGTIGNPVLFGRPLFQDLLAVSGDVGAREVVRRHRDARRLVPVPGAAPPPDIDTEEAYQALVSRFGPVVL